MSLQKTVMGRLVMAVIAVCLAVSVVWGGQHPTPLALPVDSAPWTSDLESQRFGVLEAETKARFMSGLKGVQAAGEDKLTPNMEMYDVRFYDLVLDLSPATVTLTGQATVHAVVTAGSLATMELHLDQGMSVSQVLSGGMPVGETRQGAVMTVTLDRVYTLGEEIQLVIDYAGNPNGEYFGWAAHLGQDLVWTLSEPYGAREWWPCKDLNVDKADSVALHVTVPEALIVASNGTLDSVTVPMVGKKTYHWTERYPIATYLVSVTAYPYAFYSDEYVSAQGDTMPLEYYVMPGQLANAQAGYAVIPEMIGTFAELYGEYPFIEEKYGHAHFLWGGGMEHQTCSSLLYNYYSEWLLAHELAHQWFGDLVTCEDFTDIWINEGFARWSEAYWAGQEVDSPAYHAAMANNRFLGAGTITIEDPSNFDTIFNFFLTYQKASWVPHMLRHMVGETDFVAALARIRSEREFGSATTLNVQTAFEAESGLDLAAFFQQWIYGEFYPAYQYSWHVTPQGATTRVDLRIAQTQINTGLFTMPIDVRVSTDQGDTTIVVQNSQAEQWYDFVVDGAVLAVDLDPDNWILRTVEENGVSEVPSGPAPVMELHANVPNPFNPRTEIRFHLAKAAVVQLDIFDVSGRRVQNLVAGSLAAGDHGVPWHGTDGAGRAVSSGTYFARLQSGDLQLVQSMTLVR